MKIVADTNTFIAVALNEPERDSVLALTTGCELFSPSVLPFEIGNALTAMLKRGRIDEDELQVAWQLTQQIPVQLGRVGMEAALDIATRYRIYAYDAYYLECADRLKLPLLTLDHDMKRIASQMNITILE